MPDLRVEVDVVGPWSLETCVRFWEGFTPAALGEGRGDGSLRTAFLGEADASRVEAVVTQRASVAHLELSGDGDLDAAGEQVQRFLSLDVDASGWPEVGRRDPVIAALQAELPGFRPCGFFSPYEAAAWAVLSQRIRMTQAASLRRDLIERHGGVFPAPHVLRSLDLDLPGRKSEYLHAVADAALEGLLDGPTLRALPAEEALARVASVHGLGPFAAELVVIRGTNSLDVVPRTEARFEAAVRQRYGSDRSIAEIAEGWRPFRTWAAVHLRAAGEV